MQDVNAHEEEISEIYQLRKKNDELDRKFEDLSVKNEETERKFKELEAKNGETEKKYRKLLMMVIFFVSPSYQVKLLKGEEDFSGRKRCENQRK